MELHDNMSDFPKEHSYWKWGEKIKIFSKWMVHISVKMGGGGGGMFDHFSSFTECHHYIIEDFMLLLGGSNWNIMLFNGSDGVDTN